MFISKKELEELIDRKIGDYEIMIFKEVRYPFTDNSCRYFSIRDIVTKLIAIEDYLDIHYEEKNVRGYVKNKEK